jgi:hypothetical protein
MSPDNIPGTASVLVETADGFASVASQGYPLLVALYLTIASRTSLATLRSTSSINSSTVM